MYKGKQKVFSSYLSRNSICLANWKSLCSGWMMGSHKTCSCRTCAWDLIWKMDFVVVTKLRILTGGHPGFSDRPFSVPGLGPSWLGSKEIKAITWIFGLLGACSCRQEEWLFQFISYARSWLYKRYHQKAASNKLKNWIKNGHKTVIFRVLPWHANTWMSPRVILLACVWKPLWSHLQTEGLSWWIHLELI